MIVAVNSRTGDRHRFPNDSAFVAWLRHHRHQADVLTLFEVAGVPAGQDRDPGGAPSLSAASRAAGDQGDAA